MSMIPLLGPLIAQVDPGFVDSVNGGFNNGAAAFDGLWKAFPASPVLPNLAQLARIFAVTGVLPSIITFVSARNYDPLAPFQYTGQFLWSLFMVSFITVAATTSGGPLLIGQIPLALRNYTNNITETIMKSNALGFSLDQAKQEAKSDIVLTNDIAAGQRRCASRPSSKDQLKCVQDLYNSTQQQLNAQNQLGPINGRTVRRVKAAIQGLQNTLSSAGSKLVTQANKGNIVGGAADAGLDLAGSLLGTALSSQINGLMYYTAAAYQFFLESSLLIVAFGFPLAIGLSVWPQTQALPIWFGGIFSIFLAKLAYGILTGLAAYIFLQGSEGPGVTYSLILGIFAPLLSLFVVGGNAFNLFRTSFAGATLAGGAALRNIKPR
jgi:hypothetical protein